MPLKYLRVDETSALEKRLSVLTVNVWKLVLHSSRSCTNIVNGMESVRTPESKQIDVQLNNMNQSCFKVGKIIFNLQHRVRTGLDRSIFSFRRSVKCAFIRKKPFLIQVKEDNISVNSRK